MSWLSVAGPAVGWCQRQCARHSSDALVSHLRENRYLHGNLTKIQLKFP